MKSELTKGGKMTNYVQNIVDKKIVPIKILRESKIATELKKEKSFRILVLSDSANIPQGTEIIVSGKSIIRS